MLPSFYFPMKSILLLTSALLTGTVLHAQMSFDHEANKLIVPLGGNAWIISGKDVITDQGLQNWTDPKSICRVFVRVDQPGSLNISVQLTTAMASRVKVKIASDSVVIKADSHAREYPALQRTIVGPGYVAVDIQGIDRAGDTYGSISGIAVSGTAVTDKVSYVRNNEGNYFYWGRRGPSVHLRYDISEVPEIAWFYSEITVPEKSDVIGSYFMANGFGEGYFGIQVNSEVERRILFSVWSPFATDDPKNIPEAQRIVLLKKGEGVTTGEFGNEGSGGQSFLRYMWKTNQTYGFLLRAQPEKEATVYTAWFFAPELNRWTLIASFRRPTKATYLTGLYSFLENFIPETGITPRMARYGNQWARSVSGKWTELRQAKFTGDNTARKNYRKDYAGGMAEGSFFLKNCGFFSEFTSLDQSFARPASGKSPTIDFASLP